MNEFLNKEAEQPVQYRKWHKFELTYSFQNFDPRLSQRLQINAASLAFSLWEEATAFQFTRISDQADADIKLYWILKSNSQEPGWANPPPSSRGRQQEDGSMWFNLNREWHFGTSDTDQDPVDFVTLCAHEIGHAIGIGHYCMFGRSLMSSPYTGSFREINDIDSNCYQQLYHSTETCDECCTYFEDE